MGVLTSAVFYKAEIDAIDSINDFNQQFSLMLLEYIRWEDPRLAFGDIPIAQLPSLQKAHSSYGIDITSAAGVIWKPDFLYVDQVDEETYQQQYFLSPEGSIVWMRKIFMDFKCEFNFRRYPNDLQTCFFKPYISNFPTNLVLLVL